MSRTLRWMGWALASIMAGAACWVPARAAETAAGPNPTAVEALRRLKGRDLGSSPALQAALRRVVDASRGTPLFVEWVRDFGLKDEEPGLLEVAAVVPDEPVAAEAMRLAVKSGGPAVLRKEWSRHPERREAWIRAGANAADPALQPWLLEVMEEQGTPLPSRATALRGLVRTEGGAKEVLRIAREGRLDEDLKTTATLALAQARWPGVRAEAATVLPLPKSADGLAIPSPAELSRVRGDATRGAGVFRAEKAGCIKCHRVGAEGIDVGPALTEIGTKLGRLALYESILDPSAGISFGYEGWTVETRGGETVEGLLASETPAELVIKQVTGALVRVPTADVKTRTRQRLSVMPSGLGALLGRQELVDLVEYLTTLKAN